jgi:hypothetical protein
MGAANERCHPRNGGADAHQRILSSPGPAAKTTVSHWRNAGYVARASTAGVAASPPWLKAALAYANARPYRALYNAINEHGHLHACTD